MIRRMFSVIAASGRLVARPGRRTVTPSWTRRTVLLLAGVAAIVPTAGHVQAQSSDVVDAPVRQLYAALQDVMHAGTGTPFARRFDTLAPVVEKVFDLNTVLRVSVGSRWAAMPPAAQASLLQAYRRFTIATYVANFDREDGEHFRFVPDVRSSGADRIVETELVPKTGQPIRIDYLMHNESGSWRVIDVLLDGSISRVAVQRSDFRKVLETGNADALIANLRKKTSVLSDGALDS